MCPLQSLLYNMKVILSYYTKAIIASPKDFLLTVESSIGREKNKEKSLTFLIRVLERNGN